MTDEKREQDWIDFADKLLGVALSVFSEADVPRSERGAGDPKVLAMCLLVRTISNFKGVLTLINARLIVEA